MCPHLTSLLLIVQVVDARHLLTGSFNYTRQAVLNNQEARFQ
jgi:hypothetical protein